MDFFDVFMSGSALQMDLNAAEWIKVWLIGKKKL